MKNINYSSDEDFFFNLTSYIEGWKKKSFKTMFKQML